MTNHARFIGLLRESLPELRDAVEREKGLYGRTRALVEFVNAAIRTGDWTVVRRGYSFVERILTSEPDDKVLNAICVTFIEHLDFVSHPTHGPAAKKLLPSRLLAEWKSLEAYWKNHAPKAMPEKTAELLADLQAWRKSVDAQMPKPNPEWDPAKAKNAAKQAKAKKSTKKEKDEEGE